MTEVKKTKTGSSPKSSSELGESSQGVVPKKPKKNSDFDPFDSKQDADDYLKDIDSKAKKITNPEQRKLFLLEQEAEPLTKLAKQIIEKGFSTKKRRPTEDGKSIEENTKKQVVFFGGIISELQS